MSNALIGYNRYCGYKLECRLSGIGPKLNGEGVDSATKRNPSNSFCALRIANLVETTDNGLLDELNVKAPGHCMLAIRHENKLFPDAR